MASQGQRLDLKQSQSLVMSQQLQQSLKLLQMSNMELNEFVEAELVTNPLLSEEGGEGADDGLDVEALEELNKEAGQDASNKTKDALEAAEDNSFMGDDKTMSDMQYDNVWSDDGNNTVDESPYQHEGLSLQHMSTSSSGYGDDDGFARQNISADITLKDFLYDQIMADFVDPAERLIAYHLLDLIDESGYLTADTSFITELLQCTEEDIEAVLVRLQDCDPAGVFARSLSECLALQLKVKGHCDPAMEKVLENLHLIAEHKMSELKKISGMDDEDIKDAIAEIQSLNPKPGNQFSSEPTQVMQPDVFVKRGKQGEWLVELNSEALPKVLVNRAYFAHVKQGSKSKEDKQYVMDRLNHANWLVRSLNQRAETLLKVATEIVNRQAEFFERGVYHLKPMVLSDIADELDIHESTVGRVTTSKFMSTQRGVYDMKFFFSSGVETVGDDNISSTSVKEYIKDLINKETADSILSDEAIVKALNDKGIDCARRTVAKYRESMDIPPSSVRRRMKKSSVA